MLLIGNKKCLQFGNCFNDSRWGGVGFKKVDVSSMFPASDYAATEPPSPPPPLSDLHQIYYIFLTCTLTNARSLMIPNFYDLHFAKQDFFLGL